MAPRTLAALGVTAGLALAGCATFENGATEQVLVVSDPPGATVAASYGDVFCKTPCRLDVSRTAAFTVFVDKPGFEPASTQVSATSTASAAALSRDVTADYVGRVVDARLGAETVHTPNPVVFRLKKADPSG